MEEKTVSVKSGDVVLFIFDSDEMTDDAFVVFALTIGFSDVEKMPMMAHYRDIQELLRGRHYERICRIDKDDSHGWQKSKALGRKSWCNFNIKIDFCFRMEIWRKGKKDGR